MKQFVAFVIILLYSFNSGFSQIPKGQWRDHLPYNNAHTVAIANNIIYCATDLALFYYDTDDNSVNRMSKTNGLTDVGVGSIAYSDEFECLVIGYQNGNIDLIKKGKKYNLSDLKDKEMLGDKYIQNIFIDGNKAYLSCQFGILLIDIDKVEVLDSYIIGAGGSYLNVEATVVYQNNIFALTGKGIFKADIDDPFLNFYEHWVIDTTLTDYGSSFISATIFDNKLYASNVYSDTSRCLIQVFDGETWEVALDSLPDIKSVSSSNNQLIVANGYTIDVYNQQLQLNKHWSGYGAQHALIHENDDLWFADKYVGLVLRSSTHKLDPIYPNGPNSNSAFDIVYNNGDMLVAPGGFSNIADRLYKHAEVYTFANESWDYLDNTNNPGLDTLRDISTFAVQPGNSKRYYASAWYYGLVEIEDGSITNIYNTYNTDSILGNSIGGMAFDGSGNLWMVVRGEDNSIVVKSADGNWYNNYYNGQWTNLDPYKIIYTKSGNLWTISKRGEGFFVWNSNNTPENEYDDEYIKHSLRDADGEVIDKYLNDIIEDKEGVIWIASNNGVAVYNSPNNVFSSSGFYASKPQIVVDGTLRYLLKGESVSCIVVDGANRKWFGTNGSGISLVSADGTEQLLVYNTDNSPLPSDVILSMEMNQKTGELFIGTDKGIVSFMTTAIEGKSSFSNLYAFPNPVKSDYAGLITIRGLMYQTNVKITDLSGNIVYETTSNGGDAVWNGKNMNGETVSTGVYLVLCSSADGSQTETTKIMVIK